MLFDLNFEFSTFLDCYLYYWRQWERETRENGRYIFINLGVFQLNLIFQLLVLSYYLAKQNTNEI